ncbi:CPBP family intramembrane glutamic endopeptidase [Candidatus Thiothrix sp. Deng01]|uniref:CPBP family intramembrane glutamic endopeptidase n=1 Tax=Candidatus Thiothrix phosphatis TaxID=3112415 RepID=A0ABU6D2J8_9GAMM|nr:CPBP family intramembrane glutamic endopeptidase [Candidatus Thiothrix sp. Deng01]MEB4592582.1 CPBP family intramembrane glutamic endopeptidase [Candidatus Thiothrix sp. Deng01]
MNTHYLTLASLGKNNWWRYLVSIVLIAFFWQVIGALPLMLLIVMVQSDSDPSTNVDLGNLRFEGVDSIWPYLGINFTILGMLLGLYFAVRFVHQRYLRTVVTPLEQIDWRRVLQGFVVFFTLIALATLVEAMFKPGEYQVTFDARQFLLFLPVALVVTPLQAAAEELLFRGYIMQGLGRLTSNKAIPIVGSSLLFMAAHLTNPEMAEDAYLVPLLYFLLALFLAFITVKSNSLELAIGVHAANNLFAVLIMDYEDSALPAPSIFMASSLDPINSLISFTIIAAAFYWIVFMWRKS